jgi:AcrR family transcriptional regulator
VTTHPPSPSLRADAAENRQRIIEAAREVFADQGVDAPLEEIVRRAGVGIATLYRRFPTRDDFVAASFEDKMAQYAEAVEQALADPDPWSGFCDYLERVCAMQAADQGLRDVLTMTFPSAKALEQERDRAVRGLTELIARAQAQGDLRDDFVPEDVILVLMANSGVIHGTREHAPSAWERLVGFLIDAFRADRATELPPTPTPRQMTRALNRLSRPRRDTT